MDSGSGSIRVVGARLHNLQNVSLAIPKNKLVVMTGLSGSGKSTLAIDTLHQEGQRQYLESLGLVTGFVSKPAVDSITGLSPSISVGQHLTNNSPRSTVGTVTEVFTYLRLLWARLGHRPCPACGLDIPPAYHLGDGVLEEDDEEPALPCPHCGTPVPGMVMGTFSFNKPAGACPTCTGLGVVIQADVRRLIDDNLSVAGGAVLGWHPLVTERAVPNLRAAAEHYGFTFDADRPVKALGEVERDLLIHGVGSPQFGRHFPGVTPPATVARGRFEGVATATMRKYADRITDEAYRTKAERFLISATCADCEGTRLRPESRRVTVAGTTIVDAARLPLDRLAAWLDRVDEQRSPQERLVAEPVVADLRERVRRLVDVGVGYLTLDQATPSLSAGETQRLRLAALLGSGLTGVLYVLDEPTIGLHPADTAHLIAVLRRLRDLGNTVLVIEHDLDVLRAADHLVDIGPGAGRAGGHVVAAGTPEDVAQSRDSVTGDHLSGRRRVPVPVRRRPDTGAALVIRGARAHNLKDITVRLPLGLFVAVTGPSGSGKSSLMLDILGRAARRRFHGAGDAPAEHDGIDGWEHLDKVVMIDQQPISRLPRSNAATYSDAFTPIREKYAQTAGGPGARPDRGTFLVQRARRPVRTLRGCRRARREHALPAGRTDPLPGLSRTPVHPRGPRRDVPGPRHRRGAGDDRRGGGGRVRGRTGRGRAAADPGRRRAGLSAAGPAGHHAVRRRGAAGQTREGTGPAFHRPYVVPAGRADHGPARRGHRTAARGPAAPGRRGQYRRHRRAPDGRRPGRRLGHRPGAGRRGRRWPGGRRGHAGGGGSGGGVAYGGVRLISGHAKPSSRCSALLGLGCAGAR